MKDSLIWYALVNGKSLGPYSENMILKKIILKELSKDTLIWNKESGSPDWKTISDVFGLGKKQFMESKEIEKSDTIEKPKKITSSKNHIIEEDTFHPWRRFIARNIDFIIFAGLVVVPFIILFFMLVKNPYWLYYFSSYTEIFILLILLASVALWGIFALFIGFLGATPGKYLMGIKVISKENKKIGFIKAFKREFWVCISGYWGLSFLLCIIMLEISSICLQIIVPYIFSFFMLLPNLVQYYYLESQRKTTWDKRLDVKIIYNKVGIIKKIIVSILVLLFICSLVVQINQLRLFC